MHLKAARSAIQASLLEQLNHSPSHFIFPIDPARGLAGLKRVLKSPFQLKNPGILEEVNRIEEKLAQFKKELSRYVRGTFTDPASLRPLVSEALAAWSKRQHSTTDTVHHHDPETYLKALEDDSRQSASKA